jgi:hypothetical protein
MHGKNPTRVGHSMVYSIRTGRARIEAPLAFGTGEGDADRCSAQAGMVPPVAFTVIDCGGFAVSRVRATSTAGKPASDGDSRVAVFIAYERFGAMVNANAYTHCLDKAA